MNSQASALSIPRANLPNVVIIGSFVSSVPHVGPSQEITWHRSGKPYRTYFIHSGIINHLYSLADECRRVDAQVGVAQIIKLDTNGEDAFVIRGFNLCCAGCI